MYVFMLCTIVTYNLKVKNTTFYLVGLVEKGRGLKVLKSYAGSRGIEKKMWYSVHCNLKFFLAASSQPMINEAAKEEPVSESSSSSVTKVSKSDVLTKDEENHVVVGSKETVNKVLVKPSPNITRGDETVIEEEEETKEAKQSLVQVVKDKKVAPKVSMAEVLASNHLSDASKFHVFKALVEEGMMSNKEVGNSVLYLVSLFTLGRDLYVHAIVMSQLIYIMQGSICSYHCDVIIF